MNQITRSTFRCHDCLSVRPPPPDASTPSAASMPAQGSIDELWRRRFIPGRSQYSEAGTAVDSDMKAFSEDIAKDKA